MKDSILSYIKSLPNIAENIQGERKKVLEQISSFIVDKAKQDEKALLIYICTHNSRRSHFGQIWAQVLADFMKLNHVETFSGGTEETVCHPNTLKALQSIGFEINTTNTVNNVKVSITNGDKIMQAWSKVYDTPENPQTGFCAILTCSEADNGCPFVIGAAKRISCPYDDPKQADGSAQESDAYLQTSLLVAAECWYVMDHAKRALQGYR